MKAAFDAWLRYGAKSAGRPPSGAGDAPAQSGETKTMLEETVREWSREWREQGRAEGVEQGRAEGVEQGRAEGVEQGRAEGVEQGIEQERALLCRLAARKFDGTAAEGLAAALAGVTDPERLARVGDWIIECATAPDLLARVRGDVRSAG